MKLFFPAALLVAASARPMPVLYEISTRPWLYSLARSGVPANCGDYVCLRDIPRSEWQKLADMKIDMVWLMGIWQLGVFGPEQDKTHINNFRGDLPDVQPDDIIGSPYAIQNYTVNPSIGTKADLADVRGVLKEFGMKLMVDFVPNHGAVDSVWAAANPEVFIQRPSGGSDHSDWWINREGHTFAFGRGPYDGPWTDTLQYNYWNEKAVNILKEALISVASQADAVRCDMAMLILNDVIQRSWSDVMRANGQNRPSSEFWKVAIDAVRQQFPDTIFMAEAYDYGMTNPPEKQFLQNLGFNFVYDKTILDKLKANNIYNLQQYIKGQSQGFFERTAHFVENHDEQRAALSLGGQHQAFAGAVVASTIPGLRLFFEGQFEGYSKKLDVQLRRATSQAPNAALRAQYSALLSVVANDVFHNGTWTFINTAESGSSWRLSAWRWRSADGSTKRLVIVNLSDQEGWANIQVADASNGSSDDLSITELLTNTTYLRKASALRSSGLVCGLAPFASQIFSYDPSQPSSRPVIV